MADYIATMNFDVAGQPYRSRLVGPPTITRRLEATRIGPLEIQQWRIGLMNGDAAYTPYLIADMRGKRMTVKTYEGTTATNTTECSGIVESVEAEGGTVWLAGSNVDMKIFDTMIPKVTVDTTTWPAAIDVGKVIPVVFGNARLLKLLHVKADDGASQHDYIVCHGTTAQIATLYREETNINGARSFTIISPAQYTVSSGGHYSGYKSVRFTVAQTNTSGALAGIYANVSDASSNYDFVFSIYSLVTATWGLGLTGNLTSFQDASVKLASTSSFRLQCDGAMVAQRPAQDYLRQMLMVRGMRLAFNAAGEVTISVDSPPTSIKYQLQDGLGVGVRTLAKPGKFTSGNHGDRPKTYTLRFGKVLTDETWLYAITKTVDTTGKDVDTERNQFISDARTADQVCDYLSKRLLYHTKAQIVGAEVNFDAHQIAEGDTVLYSYAPYGVTSELFQVTEVGRSLTKRGVNLSRTHLGIWQYSPSASLPPVAPINIYDPADVPPPPGDDIVQTVVSSRTGLYELFYADSSYHQVEPVSGTVSVPSVTAGNTLTAKGYIRGSSLGILGGVITEIKLKITNTFNSTSQETTVNTSTTDASYIETPLLVTASAGAGTHTYKLEARGVGGGTAALQETNITIVETVP